MRYIYQLHMAIQWKWMWAGNAVVGVQVNSNFVLMFRTDQFNSLDALKVWGGHFAKEWNFHMLWPRPVLENKFKI